MTTLMLVGATGLVGAAVLRQAQSDARVSRVVPHECIAKFLLGAAVTAPREEHIIESDAIVGETT